MTDLALFIDSYETEYPGPVRELLTQSSRMSNIYASVTPENQGLFLCNNILYIFSNKDTGIPNTYKLTLPSTGLVYSADSVCVFKNAKSNLSRPSVIAVSPEGVVRYWSDVSKPHHDERINLNNEVASSICLIESQDHLYRFLISTTTAPTFYIVEIFFNNIERSENLSFHMLEMNSAAGIGKRMSMLLFGSFSGEKELILKTLFVRGKLRSKQVEIIAILSRSLRFFSLTNQSLLHEVNVVELFLAQRRQIPAANVSILDADVYQKGILILIVVRSSKDRFVKVEFFIGYIKEKHSNPDQCVSSFLPILLPDSMSQMESSKLEKCKLFVTNPNECVIVLPKSIISMKYPNSDQVDAVVLDEIDDTVLGAAVVDGFCQIVLKDRGICAIRRLPQHFDLKFCRKYCEILNRVEENSFSDNLLKNAFLAFCSKDLGKAKEIVDLLTQKTDVNIAELAIEFDKFFINSKPSDLRWIEDESLLDIDQKEWLLAQKINAKNFQLIFEQLEDKLCQHNMLVLFIQQFNLLELIDRSVSSYNGRTGTVVLAEFGEKLILMSLCISWLAKQREGMPSIVKEAIDSLAQEFTRRFEHRDSPYLTSFDHVFNEVFYFGELISTVVSFSDKALKKLSENRDKQFRMVIQVGAFLSIMAEGIGKAKDEERILIVPEGTLSWLNELLIHFIRHLHISLDILENCRELGFADDYYSIVLQHNVAIAKFVLSQQEPCRRENSRIIAHFLRIGESHLALQLAENFHDFTTIIEYCHNTMNEKKCQESLDKYKIMFEKNDFDLFLYDYYRKKGMVNYLLAEKGSRLNTFLSEHENINWIKNIDNNEYSKACRILKGMAFEETDDQKKLIELSLCKLCVLCDSNEDMGELAELSDSIQVLSEKLQNTKPQPVS